EQRGVLALAQVTGIQETNTEINNQPLVKLDLRISGPGVSFTSHDRVLASIMRLPIITNRKLVVLVDPATKQYQIDWDRSGLIGGLTPATFTLAEDGTSHDLTGQSGPLMEILQILKAHNIGMDDMIDLRANPAAREQVQAVVRRAAARDTSAPVSQTAPAAPFLAPPEPSTARRLQELETLRATGAITEDEYAGKRRQIIADL
ncbi:SHOCT domain-containing protein, partial [Mycobacterium sp. NPDC003449]